MNLDSRLKKIYYWAFTLGFSLASGVNKDTEIEFCDLQNSGEA